MLGGIVVTFSVGEPIASAQRRRISYPEDFNAYLRIGEDGRVGCFTGKIEMGQGIITSMAQAKKILREFDVDCWITFVRESGIMRDPMLDYLTRSDVTWHSAFIVSTAFSMWLILTLKVLRKTIIVVSFQEMNWVGYEIEKRLECSQGRYIEVAMSIERMRARARWIESFTL